MWKDYFSFNKRQRNGVIVLLSLIMVMLVWLGISNHIPPTEGNVDFSGFKAEANQAKSIGASKDSIAITKPGIRADSVHFQRFNINTTTIKELSKQRDIGYFLAQAIVNYREQHGKYKEVSDLLKNAAIDKITYNKIAPYLTVD